MTRTPVDVVRGYLDALLAGDLDAIRECFTPDAVWRMHSDLPLGGPWVGRDAIVDDFLSTLGGSLFAAGSQTFDFPTLISSGEIAVLEWRVQATTAAGEPYDNEYCGVFIVRDDRIHEVREYLDTRYASRLLYPELTR